MQRYVTVIANRSAKHLGVEMQEYSPGTAKARMAIKGHHRNNAGTVHGGAIFSLAAAMLLTGFLRKPHPPERLSA